MRDTISGSNEPKPEKPPLHSLEQWELSNRISHEPGCNSEQLKLIEDRMNELNVGESFEWTSETHQVFTITKVEEKFYTLDFPQNYKRS